MFTTQAVHADAGVLKKQLIRELDITEDVDEIEAFLEGMNAAFMINEAFFPGDETFGRTPNATLLPIPMPV